MRKLSYFLIFVSAIMLMACEKPTEPTTATLTLSPVTVQMKVGEMVTIDATGTAKNIEWTSSDESVATVYYGVVTAKAIGMTVITARSGEVSAECQVFVSGSDGSTLRITPAVVSLKKGETYQFSYGNTFGLDLTWSSSDESIASITPTGLVTAHKGGNATITLSTTVGSVTALVAVEHTWGEYQLVWSDEFNGTSLDESNWTPQIGGGG